MHVVMFADQHLESLGGAQVSMRLQRRFLEKAGHTVTVVAPRMHGARGRSVVADAAYIDLPSVPITLDREYSFTWPGARTDRFVDRALAGRPPVDVVHVQADFWGAFIGHRFATGHGLPVVHTMHNRVDVGIRAVTPFSGAVLWVLNAWQRRALGPSIESRPIGRGGWSYLWRFATRSQAVTAPSSHFARRLEAHGVVPSSDVVWNGERLERHPVRRTVDVVWNGIDDDALDAALAAASSGLASADSPHLARRPRLVWIGRMSPEKRLLPFIEAVADSGIDADVEIIGGGGQLRAAQKLVAKRGPTASVVFAGRLSYAETLRRIAQSDAVVQTSIGFETQGMTVFEAASLGTPAIVSDPDIGAELESGFWPVADASTAALAETLRRATAAIVAGSPVRVNPEIRERFRQSSRTAAMVEVYRRAIAR